MVSPVSNDAAGNTESESVCLGDSSLSKGKVFRLVHLSDLHLACMDEISWRDLLNKRILGYVRWKLGRSKEYDYRILSIIEKEFQEMRADHVIITGDLTHLGFPAEFRRVATWLRHLAPPGHITVVPGNHDTYISTPWSETFSLWQEYLLPCSPYRGTVPPGRMDALFPTLYIKRNVAIIGVSSARPCAWPLATGRIGLRQLKRLEGILQETRLRGLFRILAIHHPPAGGVVDRRKELTDAHALGRLLKRCGCELLLHGHSHRTSVYSVQGPCGKIPVIEAPSALSVSPKKARRAGYFVYEMTSRNGGAWRCRMTRRRLVSVQDGFGTEEVREL